MPDSSKERWILLSLLLLLTLFYFWGLGKVPFHPDESTHIYMSRDLDLLFQNPTSLSYRPNQDLSAEMRYRAIDAPITRYLIGTARLITNTPALAADWDWSLDWESNLSAGAYPGTSDLLLISRIIPAFLIVGSCVFFYFAARKLMPSLISVLAVLILGLNPLILLHARRAMTEAALLFGVCFFLWAITRDRINPWLIGLSLALAFNAKQSGVFLIPVGIIAVALNLEGENILRKLLTRWSIVLGTFLVITYLINPYYWTAPFSALKLGIEIRSELTKAQMADYLGGNKLSWLQRSLALIDNLYLKGPVYSEIDKYNAAINPMIYEYQMIIFHIWGRGIVWGSTQLALSISSLYLLVKRITGYSIILKRSLLVLILSTISVAFGIITAFQIPWQRYIIPLVPLAAFWIAFGATPLIELINGLFSQPPPANQP